MKRFEPGAAGADALFRGVLESAPDAMVIVDTAGTIVLVNAQAETLFGYPREELLGQPVELLMPARFRTQHADQRHSYAVDPRVREMGVGLDLYGLRKNGEEFQAEISLSPIRIRGDTLVISAIRDITDRERTKWLLEERSLAEATLRRERDRAQQYLDTAAVMLLALDLNGRITLINREGCRILGWTEQELLGRDWVELCLPAHARSPLTQKFRQLVDGDLSIIENPVLTKSGEERVIEWRNTLLRDDEGRVTGTLSSGLDITDRKRVERESRFHQAMLTTERDLTLDGILTVDDHSHVLSFNKRFAQMWGVSDEVLSTRADVVLLQAVQDKLRHPEQFMERVRQLYDRHSEVSNDEVELTDGRTFERYSAPMRDAGGRYYGRVWYFRDVTERKDAEEALRRERDRAQRYLDTAKVMLLALDSNGRITLANRYACSLLGWTADELIGRDWIETCVPARLRDARRAQLRELLVGQSSVVGGDNLVLTRSGAERLIEWHDTVLRDDDNCVIGTFSSGSDITDRKLAEEEVYHRAQLSALRAAVGLALTSAASLRPALQQCAEALVTYLRAAFARIWTLNDGDGMLELQASAGLYTHLDGPHGRVPLGQFKIGRIAQDRTPHTTNRVIGDPEVHNQEWAKREGMVAFAGHPLIVNDRVVGVMALFARHALPATITSSLASVADHIALGIERHRSAGALRVAEERMRFALETAGVGIWDMDYTSGVLRWSEILESLYGLQPGTFGRTFEAFIALIHPEDRGTVLKTIADAARAGTDFKLLFRTIRPDGTIHWLTGVGREYVGTDGKAVRSLGVSFDVTERRLLEDQYNQAQKMEAVGRLAGGVAHDFNNLLTAILGYCELLLDEVGPDDPRREDITEIQKAGTSAAALTRQLLAFSRKQIIEPTRLDLNTVVSEMRAMLGRLIGEDVKVVLGLTPDLAPVKADRGQLEQIVLNLAVNARDAMPKGGTLTIETANVELDEHYARTHFAAQPGAYVALTISDTGTGMTPEVQARLFEPFFTTKEVGKGTGLGLATVHGIVSRAGGTIGVYSEIGKGTAFKVYLPRADITEVAVEAPPPAVRRRAGTQTVLVVEDSDGLRELARRLLERQGYTVLLAANADEAIQQFHRHASIDVLLTDVVMPGASGPELTRQLIEERPGLRVVYMSGYTEEAIVQHGILNPGIAFLHKPFTSDTLGRKIREALDR